MTLLLIVGCIPAGFSFQSFTAAARAGSSNSMVLTNASVKFRDSSYKEITSVQSGTTFYIFQSLSGNNVNQNGSSSTYTITIEDDNLLLTNFSENGFVDGATYNGFTIHVTQNADESYTRTLTYSVNNSSTKQLQLAAKFANGTTADGETATVTISSGSSGGSTSSTITATSTALSWTADKTETASSISNMDLVNGKTLYYTLKATSSGSSGSKGAWWTQYLEFSDTLTISGATFTDTDAIISQIKTAIENSGYNIVDGTLSVTADNSNTISIYFKIENETDSAEMDNVSISVPITLSTSTITMGSSDATLTNTVKVTSTPYNTDTPYSESEKSVTATITAPTGAVFTLNKTVENWASYYKAGDAVTYKITAYNTGDSAGSIEITDTLPSGLTLSSIKGYSSSDVETGSVSGSKVTFDSVAVGDYVYVIVEVMVGSNATASTYTNTAEDDHDNKAMASINVKVASESYSVSKSVSPSTYYTNYNSD